MRARLFHRYSAHYCSIEISLLKANTHVLGASYINDFSYAIFPEFAGDEDGFN